jgi:hypothetical protein
MTAILINKVVEEDKKKNSFRWAFHWWFLCWISLGIFKCWRGYKTHSSKPITSLYSLACGNGQNASLELQGCWPNSSGRQVMLGFFHNYAFLNVNWYTLAKPKQNFYCLLWWILMNIMLSMHTNNNPLNFFLNIDCSWQFNTTLQMPWYDWDMPFRDLHSVFTSKLQCYCKENFQLIQESVTSWTSKFW